VKLSHAQVVEPYVMNEIPKNLDNYMILDTACGLGSYAYKIRIGKEGKPIIVGLDIWKPYLMKIKALRLFDDLILGDAMYLPFCSSSFDIVLASEIIEHLPKGMGKKLLSEIERISKKLVVVVTPCGFMPQDDVRGNPYEAHLSGWNPEDFKLQGYDVRIVNYLQLPKTLNILYKIEVWLAKRILRKRFVEKEIIAIKRLAKENQ
jgi:hypothetical protein